jgi:Protein of unknown function (DUF4031)
MIVVDEIRTYATEQIKPAARRFGNKWCHMMTDGSQEELHAFAARLGLSRASYQEHATLWHYDLVPSKRQLAVRLGAQEVAAAEWIKGDWYQARLAQGQQKREQRMIIEPLRALIDPYDRFPLDCDGFIKIAHTELTKAGIAHQVYAGQVIHLPTGTQTPPHFWIVLETERPILLDYRVRLWLKGQPGEVPHGVFQPEQYPQVLYQGEPCDLACIGEREHALLTAIPYGTLYLIGYTTPGVDAYFEALMANEQTVAVEGRFTPYARGRVRWCRQGPEGLAATWKDRYCYFSERTVHGSGSPENWLGNEHYRQPELGIKIVNLELGLTHLYPLLVMGKNVALICMCQTREEHDYERWGCHLKQIVEALHYVAPGLPIQFQPRTVPLSHISEQ